MTKPLTLAVLSLLAAPAGIAWAQAGPAPALEPSISIPWTPVFRGDPLRVRVRLASPRAQQQALRGLRAREEGREPAPSAFAPPPVTWADLNDRIAFRLYRVLADGTYRPVPKAPAWTPSQPYTDALMGGFLSKVRLGVTALVNEWFAVPDTDGGFLNGEYELQAGWDSASVVGENLPSGGARLAAQALRFTVRAAASDSERAIHEYRLAFHAQTQGRYEECPAACG